MSSIAGLQINELSTCRFIVVIATRVVCCLHKSFSQKQNIVHLSFDN